MLITQEIFTDKISFAERHSPLVCQAYTENIRIN